MGVIRELARHLAVQFLGRRPLLTRRLRALSTSDPLVILNLHRVAQPDGSAFRPLSPRLFEDLLQFARKHFSLVTFATAGNPAPKPRMILSFDDGYRDFVDVAMPILRKYGVRANQNVIPGSVESGLPPLQVLAADFIGAAPRDLIQRLEVPGFAIVMNQDLERRLDSFLRDRPHNEQQQLAEILIPQFFAWDGFRPAPMMSREELQQAAAEHEVGGHSYDHATMAVETDDYLVEDVRRCRAWLKDVTGRQMQIYAFPNGSYLRGQPEAVRDAGIEHVLLAGGGLGGTRGIYERVGFAARSKAEMRFRALGARAPL